MPFTPAHVAAVLPLRGRAGLPFAALAAGSMSPDLPYYLLGTGWQPVPATHSLWAIPTWDLLFGLVMWAAFRRASQPLHDLSPEVVRRRWRLADVAASRWWLTPVAVLIGSLTHLLWDEFTHPGRFGTANLAMLAATYPSPIGPLEGYRYLQYGSGLFGLAVLAWVGLRASVCPAVPRRQPVLAAWAPVVVLAGGSVAAVVGLGLIDGPASARVLGFRALTALIGGAFVALAALCVVHAVAERLRTVRQ